MKKVITLEPGVLEILKLRLCTEEKNLSLPVPSNYMKKNLLETEGPWVGASLVSLGCGP